MIIKDVYGKKLSLTKTKLTEIDHESLYPFYAPLENIRASYRRGRMTRLRIYGKDGSGHEWRQGFPTGLHPNSYRIGCREFSPEVFAKILKAAGVKPVRKTDKKVAHAKT
jgi:hypothetical protein